MSNKNNYQKNLKKTLNTAILSDVMDDMGYQYQMLPIEIKPNYPEAKFFGRARTMSLRPILNGNYHEIYKGILFLENMKPGEVLMIGNAFFNYAFFGELMSTVAKKKGVDGVVIDGCTRDHMITVKMKYPVFAKNHYARDIKNRGIVNTLDLEIRIGEVSIKPGDYVFGDADGIIVIPRRIENDVINKALQIADLEEKIKQKVTKGVSVQQIMNELGEF